MKKTISIILCLAVLFTFCVPASASSKKSQEDQITEEVQEIMDEYFEQNGLTDNPAAQVVYNIIMAPLLVAFLMSVSAFFGAVVASSYVTVRDGKIVILHD